MTDFQKGVPEDARLMLREMSERDLTIANLYMKAILEEVPDVAMLEEALQPDMFERLRELPSFREYEAKVKEAADAEAAETIREAELRAAAASRLAAAATAKRAKAEAVEAAAAAIEKARADGEAQALIKYFGVRGDWPSIDVIRRIMACEDAIVLDAWLDRAYQGERAADIFSQPQQHA